MKLLKDILKGVLIGIANIIPGVSGGTMAVSMGIYDKMIYAINNIRKQFKKSIKFLLPYIIGAVISIAILSVIIEMLFDRRPLETSLGFIGLIVGGIPVLLKKVKNKGFKASYAISFVCFFALIIVLQLLQGNEGTAVVLNASPKMMIILFLVGILASATMVIPGVSGSMILMLLGFYQPIIDMISQCVTALKDFDFNLIFKNGIILLPFAIGVLLGIVIIAKLITFLFEKFETVTFYGIIGLVAASPFAVLMNSGVRSPKASNIIIGIIACAAGITVTYFLGGEEA
jgi:putative membrane protein